MYGCGKLKPLTNGIRTMFHKQKISGIYKESAIPLWLGAIIICATAVVIYQPCIYLPWRECSHELLKSESLYAVIAQECSFSTPVPTAHHVQQLSEGILFPAMTSLLHRCTNIAMETSLRTVATIMLLLTAALAGISASTRNTRAGLVAAAITISSVIAIDKAAEGYPTTTNAFLLLAAQLTFFHFGIRKANWNLAWLFSASLILLAFFSGGFRMLIYFVFPMFFFRRPLSVKSKFRKPGFIIAVVLLILAVSGYGLYFSISTGKGILNELLDSGFQTSDYWKNVLQFPFMLPILLLPWSIITWLPFCVALQTIDPTPIFSRYLRTLTLSTLLLLWLMPSQDSKELLYLIGPLAIQTGIFYDIGMSRYGNRIRKFMIIGEILLFALLLIFIATRYASEDDISKVLSISKTLSFRTTMAYQFEFWIVFCCCLILCILFYNCRRTSPVWLLLLILALSAGFFYGFVLSPYQAQSNEKRILAAEIKSQLKEEKTERLYKYDIKGFYGGLFYTGIPIYQLNNITELPENAETVYLISTKFPQTFDRKWSNLLPTNYTYQKEKLYLWKGELKKERDDSI